MNYFSYRNYVLASTAKWKPHKVHSIKGYLGVINSSISLLESKHRRKTLTEENYEKLIATMEGSMRQIGIRTYVCYTPTDLDEVIKVKKFLYK